MKKDVKKFRELKSWQLALLGGVGAFGSSITIYFFGNAWPLYMKAIQASEIFSFLGLYVSILLAGIGLMGIMFMALGKRCGEILYQRHMD